jgi:sugar/nucleoside kinase (ribokinase family)
MPFVAVIGNLVKDVVGGAPPRVGGAVFYQARAFSRIAPEMDVHLVTRCSVEDRDLLVPPLQAFGLPLTWRAAGETQSFSFHYEGERRVMEVDALGDPWTPADIQGWVADAIGDAPWIMVGALTRADFPAETLSALRTNRRQLLVDGQGFVRRGTLGSLVSDSDVPPESFASVRGLKLSESEACVLVGSTEPDDLRKLCVPEVVLTRGAQGTLVVTAESAEHIPAVPVDAPVDPTGAGDTFWVAYLVARSDGALPLEAARTASETTSAILAATSTGG